MFRSLFQDHLQGSSFALSAYHASAARFFICLYWHVVVCPLFVFVSSVPACVLSGRSRPYLLGAKGGRCLRLTTECLGTLEASYSWISKCLSGPVIEYL
jgi:hypothetical protein